MSLRRVEIVKEHVFNQFADIADEISESESHRLWRAIKCNDLELIETILNHYYSDKYVTKFIKSLR